MITKLNRLAKRIRSARADQHGVALIEFAMVFPILVVLYLGGFQLMEAVSVYRKLTTTARSLSDLSAQLTTADTAKVDTILAASEQIMAPYATSQGTYRISLIDVQADGTTTVKWSRSRNGTPLVKDAPYILPADIKRNGNAVIVCDVTYNHKPVAFSSLIGPMTFKDQIFMVPRDTDTAFGLSS